MGLNQYTAIGRIANKEYKQIGDSHVCAIKVAVNTSQGSGEKRKEETIWFELSAWSNERYDAAKSWDERYTKGDWVSITGEPFPRVYKTKDGEPGFSLVLNRPTISKLPTPKVVPTEAAVASEEMPF